jgi:hypothetical protein
MIAVDVQTLLQWAQTVQALAAVVAIVFGGMWTYRLFVKNRLGKPSATISHQVIVKDLDDCCLLVHISVFIENRSAILMKIPVGEVRLVPVLPLASELAEQLGDGKCPMSEGMEIAWPGVVSRPIDWRQAPREIEPHESDTFHFDFVVRKPISTFQVYSYFKNATKHRREIGWNTTTIHDVPKEACDA